jgi:hypothetical protein
LLDQQRQAVGAKAHVDRRHRDPDCGQLQLHARRRSKSANQATS